MRAFLRTAYGVMAVVIAQYVLKVALKGGFGALTHSPVFTGDGWHNASDIFQALLVIFGVWLSRRPPSRAYPLGWRGLDALGTLAIGLSLGYVAVVSVFVPSLCGIVATVPWLHAQIGAWIPDPENGGSHLLSGGYGPAAVAIMLVSSGVSYAMGRWQIRIGGETGHASVEADGRETLSDGKVELLTAAGIGLQAAFGFPWLEYLLGFGMAYIMLHTASEILGNAGDMILSRSLGEDTEERIRAVCERVAGVDRAAALTTYRRGPYAVVDLTVQTRLGSRGREDVRRLLSRKIAECLEDKDASVTVRFVAPDPRKHREALLARRDGDALTVVGNVYDANVLVICEVEDGVMDSCYDQPVTPDTAYRTMVRKHVDVLHVCPAGDADRVSLRATFGSDPRVREAPSSVPVLLGVPLD